MKQQQNQFYRLIFWLLVSLGVTTILLVAGTTKRMNGQQQFDAAATATALVQTREAIVATVTASAASNPVAKAVAPSKPTAAPAAAATVPIAEVRVKGLNIRSGPGTGYAIRSNANVGQRFTILGQSGNCAWLKVGDMNQPSTEVGWISGNAQYTAYTTACTQIPQASAPVLPPTKTPRSTTPAQTNQANATGCYILENQLALQLTITLSRADGWSDSFQLAPGTTREYCAPPGTYNYTISLPPPLSSMSGVLTIKAGDRFYLPLKL